MLNKESTKGLSIKKVALRRRNFFILVSGAKLGIMPFILADRQEKSCQEKYQTIAEQLSPIYCKMPTGAVSSMVEHPG